MNEYDEIREKQINALLDGELDQADADELKSAATDDRELARAIVEAYQLQQVMDGIPVERAPASLGKRLRAIPREQRPATGIKLFQPRWVMALAAVPLAIIAVSLMRPDTPSEAEIAKARQELAIAFAYLDKAGAMTGRGIESTVGHTMADAITGSVNRAIKLQNENSKEKEA
jgi:anti-sigma factor RsiW